MNFSNIFKNISLNTIVSNTNKTLNVIKKTIPVYKEVRPYFRGEKKLLKNENSNVDEIKESKPLKQERNITFSNNNLTFFQ